MNQEQKEKLEKELDRLQFFLLELSSEAKKARLPELKNGLYKARIQALDILRALKDVEK